jgi:hypothetical protein
MIFSATTEIYDNVFVENYKCLLKFCNNEEDRLQQTFIDVRQRLQVKPFTAHTFTEIPKQLIIYIKTSLYNHWKTETRLQKNNITQDECYWELENKLLETEILNEETEDNQVQLEYMSMRLFEYIKLNYNTEWEYVFVTYYLYDVNNKKITYAELSKITGYSISKCCKIIKTIKQDLRENLINYIDG